MKTEKFLVQVPFAGFYNSIHDEEIDRALENVFDLDGTGDANADLIEHARDAIEWPIVWEKYAAEYVENLAVEYDLGLTFESLSSPRYYNFETDRVFAYIDRETLARIWRAVPRDALRERIRERFTARDGFIPHYSSRLDAWPRRLSDWDHNELGTLLELYLDRESDGCGHDGFDQMRQYYLMEDCFGNGFIENVLFDDESARRGYEGTLNRLDAINRYLHSRAERPIRTLEQWHAARRAENRPFDGTPLGAWGGA